MKKELLDKNEETTKIIEEIKILIKDQQKKLIEDQQKKLIDDQQQKFEAFQEGMK